MHRRKADIAENPGAGNGLVPPGKFPSRGCRSCAKHAGMPRFHRIARVLTAAALFTAARAENYIRVDEDDSAARLQTAVTRMEKDGATVDLIGAVHIADKAYYEALVERFKGYDALLFEMIGGEKLGRVEAGAEPEAVEEPEADDTEETETAAPEKERDLSGLRGIYDSVARFLQLSGQSESIDYRAPNFVHADLTLAEFNRLQDERNESVLGFALKSALNADKTKTREPDAAKLLAALLTGKSNLLKLELVHTLGQGDDQIAAFAGESVIISDRNQRCIDVMNREIAAGHKNLGIFYGAAHFPDMEKRLVELGFKRVKQEWMTAWDIPKKAAPAPKEKKDAA